MPYRLPPKTRPILAYLTCLVLVVAVHAKDEKIKPEDCQPDTHYLCRDGETCITKKYVCNGETDCPGKDDEAHCDFTKCDHTSFWCRDGVKCIPNELKCDNVADCPDASDESDSTCMDAPVPEVRVMRKPCDPKKEFECEAKVCIKKSLVCDGLKHCLDGRDEDPKLCGGKNMTCPGFQCTNGQCLKNPSWECDGSRDCADGSDENHCKPDCDISNSHFLCRNNDQCIDLAHVCDGTKDCLDGSDEGGFCLKKDMTCEDLLCDGPCSMLPSGPICICRIGTKYNQETKKCEHTDQCGTYGICSQGCINTNGTHRCTCAKMFQLQSDNRSCSAYGDSAILAYSTQKRIKTIHIKGSGQEQAYSEVIAKTKQAIGVSYDGSRYYWTELSEGKEAIVRYNQSSNKKEPLFTAGLEAPEDLSVDWLTGNIYFTDAGLAHIAVCDNDGLYCTMLVATVEMENPRSIVLNPQDSLMFWTDWGKKAHIGVAYMDGSNPKTLVDGVAWPNGLALDWPNGRIYWVDAKKQTIESATINGKDRRTVLKGMVQHPFGLALFENRLYWSDWTTSSIESCDKFTGKDHEILVQGELIYDVHIYHKAIMPSKNHACINHSCSHICLLSFNSTYTCACPEYMELKSDKHTCRQSEKTFSMIFGIGNYVVAIPRQTFGKHTDSQAYTTMSNVDTMDYNSLTGEVFAADSKNGAIVSHNIRSKKTMPLVMQHVMSVTSMSFDYLTNNLYWVDYLKRTIEVISLNNKKRTIVHHFDESERPTAIAVIPSNGEMFVALESSDRFHIDRLTLNGGHAHFHVIEENLSRKGPIDIVVDESNGTVYWSDGDSKKIESSDYFGGRRKTFAPSSKPPKSVAVINDEIYWTSIGSKSLQWRKKSAQGPIKQSSLEKPPGISKLPDSITMTAGIPLKVSNHPCTVKNGGCSDICVSTGLNTRSCLCETGHVFKDKTETTCVKRFQCDFKCSSSGECLEKSQRCNNKVECQDASDEKDCNFERAMCDASEFMCSDGRQCVPQAFRCDQHFNCLDKSDEANCTETVQHNHCKSSQMRCPDGTCLDVTQRCDGKDDCDDGFDEKREQCQDVPCPKDFFRCFSGQCVPKRMECNSFVDCVDGSDEHENCTTQLCKPSMRACPSGWCISSNLFCDGHEDCEDGFDEQRCPSRIVGQKSAWNETCDETEFQCPSDPSICLKQTDRCNEVADCPKGEDEKNCPTCPSGMFDCANGQCVFLKWLCDGSDDCGDGSDEMNCGRSPAITTNYNCASDQFKCADGTCLSYNVVCDGKKDCSGGDDEGTMCTAACAGTKCDYDCRKTPKGGVCYCKDGFELRGGSSCVDIDECKISNPCSQKCRNTIGSFRCSCYDEFILGADKTTCKAQDGFEMMLLFTFDNQVRKLTDAPKSVEILVDTAPLKVSDIDVDMERQRVLYTMYGDDELVEVDLISGNRTDTFQGIPAALRIAHDWVTGNTYITHFCDDMRMEIHACNVKSKKCVLIRKLNYHEQIPAIQVDPINKFLFFVELTDFHYVQPISKLVRTRLDGSDARVILNDTHMSAMALDIDQEKVFFTEILTKSLQVIKYDGTERTLLQKENRMLKRPIAVSIFENQAYIVNQASPMVTCCKLYGDLMCREIELNVNNAKRIVIAQQSRQKEDFGSCLKHQCDDICIPADIGFKCLCKNGTVVGNGVSCDDAKAVSLKGASDSSGSSFWWWFFFIILLLTAAAGASFFVYKKRNQHGRFNLSMYFRNSEFSKVLPRSTKPTPFPRTPAHSLSSPPEATAPGMNTLDRRYNEFLGENFNFSDTPPSVNAAQVEGFSDDETHPMDNVDFNDDSKQRLIL